MSLLTALFLVGERAVDAAGVWTYVVNIGDRRYVTSAPYLKWNNIPPRPTRWISSDQYILIQTDQRYQQGNWYVQLFMDNTQVADASELSPPFRLPAHWVGPNSQDFREGAQVRGPLTPKYTGVQGFDVGGGNISLPKSGLVSADGRERIPLVWRVCDVLIAPCVDIETRSFPPHPHECVPRSGCDFTDYSWFYFLDKGDQLQTGGRIVSNWQDGFGYAVPLNQNGGQYVVGTRWRPTQSADGYTSQYIFVGANFRNGTRQVYSTTIFVELVLT